MQAASPVCTPHGSRLVCPLFAYSNQTFQGECELIAGSVVLHGKATYTISKGNEKLQAIGLANMTFDGTFEHGHLTSGEVRFNDQQYYLGDLCVGDKPPANIYQMQDWICAIGDMDFHDDDAALSLELWHFSGDFKHGLFHGHGELTLWDSDIFEGTFENGKFCGGKITHSDGSVHEGPFHCVGGCTAGVQVQFEKNCGQLTTPDGSIYQGTFNEYGKPHGNGVLTAPNGDIYSGSFKEGVPSTG